MNKLLISFAMLMLSAITFANNDKQIRDQGLAAIENNNSEEAYNLWITGAEEGDPELQHAIGLLISRGHGPIADNQRDEAVLDWMLRSANQGFPNAINYMAEVYKNGLHGKTKDQQAAKCWKEKKDEVLQGRDKNCL